MSRQRTCFGYMLVNRLGTPYTGVSDNLEFRLFQHRHGLDSKFTRKYRVHRLVWNETTTVVRAAIAREKQIKGWTRARKTALIKEMNPHFMDLAGDWRFDAAGDCKKTGFFGPRGLRMTSWCGRRK